jgi:sulfonate transport system substrate-binding protein
VDALQESDRWIQENWTEAAKLFADQDTGGGASDLPAWEHALRTRPWGQLPVTEDFIAEQQHAADLFYANGLIQQQSKVADAVLPEINDLISASR